MIDPTERMTVCVSLAALSSAETWVLAGTFTAEEDLTLRQVHFSSTGTQALSTDPLFTRPANGQQSNDFQLRNAMGSTWTDLAYPVPRGTKLYWGVSAALAVGNLVTLVYD